MTQREFKALHSVNYGAPMASDTKEDYRETMHRPCYCSRHHRPDRLAERAAYKRACRRGKGALTMGSKFRAAYRYRYTKALNYATLIAADRMKNLY